MMKKLAALLVSLLMLTTLAAAQTSDYTGTWYLNSLDMQGVTISPADIGMEMMMTLNDDGTGMIAMTDEEDQEASWVLNGETLTVTADELPRDFTLTEDGQLIADPDDTKMLFGREAASQSFVAAPEIAADSISAFDGTWTINTVNAFGMVLPYAAMADMGMTDPAIVIQNGSVTTFGEITETAAFTDGKLVVTATDDEAFGKTFSLLEDGKLAMTYMEIIFYCDKADAAE